jgi:hypothetical protein
VGRVRDNTVTTNALSIRFRSSIVTDEMGVSAAVGKDRQVGRKVEGLVVRLDRGSSNLPGRTLSYTVHFRDSEDCMRSLSHRAASESDALAWFTRIGITVVAIRAQFA